MALSVWRGLEGILVTASALLLRVSSARAVTFDREDFTAYDRALRDLTMNGLVTFLGSHEVVGPFGQNLVRLVVRARENRPGMRAVAVRPERAREQHAVRWILRIDKPESRVEVGAKCIRAAIGSGFDRDELKLALVLPVMALAQWACSRGCTYRVNSSVRLIAKGSGKSKMTGRSLTPRPRWALRSTAESSASGRPTASGSTLV